MLLSDKDKKRIGKNIQFIRKANHISVDEFASLIFFGKDKIQHIENGSYKKEDWDDIIKAVSEISGYSFNQIKFDDLSKLKKDSLYFGDKVKATEFFEVLETDNYLKELFSYMLPIIIDERSKNSKYFIDGLNQLKIALSPNGIETDIVDTISLFLDSYLKDNIISACVNVLSCLGYLYMCSLTDEINESTIERIEANNYLGIASQIKLNVKNEFLSKKKKEFFSKYNNLINECSNALNKYDEYKDYLFFYISIRYQFGMFDNDEVRMNDDEMNRFGEALFDNLFNLGNKYAIALRNYIEEN